MLYIYEKREKYRENICLYEREERSCSISQLSGRASMQPELRPEKWPHEEYVAGES